MKISRRLPEIAGAVGVGSFVSISMVLVYWAAFVSIGRYDMNTFLCWGGAAIFGTVVWGMTKDE